jgi:hypothetical protein
MASTATVTAPVGPGGSVSAVVLTGVTELFVQPAPSSMLFIKHDKGRSEFAINATTTFTVTPSSGNLTVTISQ